MNAETRAKDTAKIINASGDDLDLITDFGQLVIATAIRQAENDKLEEAERAILNEHSVAESADLNIGLLRAARAVKAIRLSTPEKD